MSAFDTCEICASRDWTVVYEGSVRSGAFGNLRADAQVARCGSCGVERLREDCCFKEIGYETEAYRNALLQPAGTAAYQATHDELQRFTIEVLWPISLRGKTVADIGCAGGSFLDHIAGTAARLIAVEPAQMYHADLTQRGYAVFPSAADAAEALGNVANLVVSSQVIEHVTNPRCFLAGIVRLLAPDGRLLITTPNRADILMELLPEKFPSFFYRTVHRWYFDAAALAACGRAAGLEPMATRFVHRYPMANTLLWLRDRRPRGRINLAGIDQTADGFWKGYLEASGHADQLTMTFRKH